MANKDLIEKELSKFRKKREVLGELGDEMIPLIDHMLNEAEISFHEVIGRVKEENSLKEKLLRGNKKLKDIKDLLGLRVITYLKSDSKKVCELIEKEFKIMGIKDHEKKINGSYRGKNYVVKLDQKRGELIEYGSYKDIEFEIQVTTILDHAWSEIQHDRNYKLKGKLPEEFKRQFRLLASTLELSDIQFDKLCQEVDKKIKEIEEKTQRGEIKDITLDSVSLRGYLNERFKEGLGEKILPTFGEGNIDSSNTIEDLKIMGINNLEELKEIIPPWINEYLTTQRGIIDYTDLVRDLLVLKFQGEYIKKSRIIKRHHNYGYIFSEKEINLFNEKGVDFCKLFEESGIKFTIES